jgi:hypothetical protein
VRAMACLVASLAAGGHTLAQSNSEPPAEAERRSGFTRQEIEEIAREAVAAPLARAEEKAREASDSADRAKAEGDRATTIASTTTTVLAGFDVSLALFSLLAIVVGGLAGFKLVHDHRIAAAAIAKTEVAATKTEQAAREAQEHVDKVKAKVVLVTSVEQNVQTAIRQLASLFREVPRNRVVGEPTPKPPQAAFDADMVMVLGDQLGLTGLDRRQLAEEFTKVGRYWQRHAEYPRASARLARAVALDPDGSHKARIVLARVYWNWAADGTPAGHSGEVDDLLRKAENQLALVDPSESSFFELGSIAHIRKDHARAVAFFTKAREVSQARASRDRGTEDWLMSYSLACALCKAGRLEECVAELERIVGQTQNVDLWGDSDTLDLRADARTDSDFEVLSQGSSETALRFQALVGISRS